MDVLRFGDEEELIASAEYALLKKIFETGSDVVKGKYCPKFGDICGKEKLNQALETAICECEEWYSEGTE